MPEAFIIDGAFASALGTTTGQCWQALCSGESAVEEIRSFDTSSLPFHHAAEVNLSDDGDCPNRVCSLMDLSLRQLNAIPEDTAVIWTGVKGDTEWIESQKSHNNEYHSTAEPFLPKHYRRWICDRLGIRDTGMEVNAACASSSSGIALGAEMIRQGQCSSVLVCACDIVSLFTFTGFAALKALSPSPCRPLDKNRDGLNLGSASVAVLLGDASAAHASPRPAMAKVSGSGISNDANHITGPARDGRGLSRAVRKALTQASITPDEIEAWCIHGTGTIYNDAMELAMMEEVFGKRKFPIFSVKGAVGHTLGAAGALEALVCAMSLREKRVPPTAGLIEPEDRAIGCASPKEQEFAGRTILTTNSGFGGVNAALVLEAPRGASQ